jgi:bifunctional DNA-binding transcriptional regulator/antitoxin component of YhaV-PrlF toxin-antitoxin module
MKTKTLNTKTTKLSSQRQITVPKNFIEEAGLNLGQLVEIILESDGRIIIQKKKSPLDEFLGLYEGKIDLTTEEYLKIRKDEAKL